MNIRLLLCHMWVHFLFLKNAWCPSNILSLFTDVYRKCSCKVIITFLLIQLQSRINACECTLPDDATFNKLLKSVYPMYEYRPKFFSVIDEYIISDFWLLGLDYMLTTMPRNNVEMRIRSISFYYINN